MAMYNVMTIVHKNEILRSITNTVKAMIGHYYECIHFIFDDATLPHDCNFSYKTKLHGITNKFVTVYHMNTDDDDKFLLKSGSSV
jgi:hypothetical protein